MKQRIYTLDRGRKEDLEQLRKMSKTTSGEKLRKLEEVARKILNEDKYVRSMRERLIMAHRRGDTEEIKDIHEFIKNKEKYK